MVLFSGKLRLLGIPILCIFVIAIVYYELGSAIVTAIFPPVPSLDVKDSFNRILLRSGNVNYVEAPANANVLSQNITDSCDASFNYKTAGLIIAKSFTHSGNTFSLSYKVTPWKTNTTVSSMNVTFWVPFGIAVVGNHTTSNSVVLDLSSGTVELSSKGHLDKVLAGKDPVYGQYRVIFNFALLSHGDTVGTSMRFRGGLSCKQLLSSRPLMTGSDELILSTSHGLFG